MALRSNDLVELGECMDAQPEFGVALAARWLRIRDREGRMVPLVANAAQLAFEERRGRQNIVLKARQMGMTTWVAGRFFLRTILRPGTMSLLVAHSRSAAEAMFCTVERMWQFLPDDLREGALVRSRANAGQMVFPVLGSEFRIASAADENAGRGLSLQNLHCSEVSRWPGDAAATLAGLRAALVPDGELVLESTPNGAYGAFYEEWMKGEDSEPTHRDGTAMNGPPKSCGEPGAVAGSGSGLVRHFFPWWMESSYKGEAVDAAEFSEEERGLAERHGLRAEQIGFRRGLKRSFGTLQSQEFAEDAETCFRATGACCFDVDAVESRMAVVPDAMERRRGGALLVWLPVLSGKRYVVALDSAGGGSDGDYAAIQVLERGSGMQCAELQERLRPADAAREAAKLAREYNGALLVVERNNHGAAVLAHLELAERYGNVYRQNGEDGWLTTAASKAEMVARMSMVLSESAELLMSRRLLAECRTFVSGVRGQASAAGGAHDDLVMSMAMGQMVAVARQ